MRTSIYLNFTNKTEEAFNFYKSVLGGQFEGKINRFGEMPPQKGQPPMSDSEKNLVMHMELPIPGGLKLMGSDVPASAPVKLIMGNNASIMIEPDTKEETERLFNALSSGGNITMPLTQMFWGAYYGMFTDKFGVQWMVNYFIKK